MIKWNTVKYIDCMDEMEGLPSLPDKSIDLCITDPPYNQDFSGLSLKTTSLKRKNRMILYSDKKDFYKEWCYSWFEQLKRICHQIIFTPGYNNRQIWFEKENFELLIWVNMLRQGASKISYLNKYEMIFCFKIKNRFKMSVFKYNFGGDYIKDIKTIHPCPKPIKLWEWLIKTIKPKSVIDPFIGSGTTAEVCTKLDIPWLGYEVNEVYSQDIDKRLNNCKKEPQQTTLF